MKKVNTDQEAFSVIFELQTLLRKNDWKSSVGFSFEVISKQEIVLNAKGVYHMELKNLHSVPYTIFCGSSIVECMNKFIDFFMKDGKAEITANRNGYQYKANFHYFNKWIVDASSGSYINRE